MAYQVPAPLDSIFSKLAVESATPDLQEALEVEQDGWGSLIVADLGERLWELEVTLAQDYYRSLESQKARLNVLRQAGRSLFVHPYPIYTPQHDPDGTILGSNQPVLDSVTTSSREIRIGGLPPGYRIYVGDYLSFQYGSNPVRYAFHQVAGSALNGEYVQASAAGITHLMEVVPNIRAGYATGASVQLIKPYFKAIVAPGSYNPGRSSRKFTSGVSVRFIQTLRE